METLLIIKSILQFEVFMFITILLFLSPPNLIASAKKARFFEEHWPPGRRFVQYM